MEHSYFFITMIYLAAAVVFIPIAKKLGLGSVLGYLLAGVVIGPSLMGFIGSEGQDLMHFAEFGVVMMLFLIGIELEPALLWNLRAPILGLGGLQVLITTAAVAGLALLLGQPLNAALALGMILSLSSTAIVLQSLKEKGQLSSAAGQSAFSVLLFQDIAVIPMLAVFPLLAGTSSEGGSHSESSLRDNLPAWGQTLVVLGAVVVIVVAGRYLLRPLLRIIAATRVRELFTAFSLLLVVAISVLMSLVGLSPALGAFLGGVVLANSEYRHELESDIEPFKGLLLGLFFMAVGASIDFKLILSMPWVILGLVIGLMALKSLILLGLGKIFKVKFEQNLLFAIALSQVGEFAFVLLSFSNQNNILPQATVSILTAVVAISMALTPLLLLAYERLIQPRFSVQPANTREADEIQEKHPIIIAGFGRFGNIVGRFLRVNGVKATILDLDSDRVDALHNLGVKVYYGDAARRDMLESAGAAEAKVIIVAMDTVEQTLEVVRVVRKHFPHLQMLVKAENIPDTFELMDLGVLHIYRETLDTSLRMGADALQMLGIRAYHAYRNAGTFRKQDEKAMKGLSAIRDDKKLYINTVKERIEELEKLMSGERTTRFNPSGLGWDEQSLIDEARQDE
ncbi:MAG: potassium efflux system protein [Bacteroidetes bacterium]|uniref:monovalent cation:proton antiporter-2 (CPA2) family protein n=1 Tax=Chitinophaga sp. LS1 TaxID=3051176 RepID=UPI001E0EC403|nr:monovalent cation:proton antiporter-2 (CPA2) family protein [Chitinophaga sp. LS1]MBP1651120.1 potassium efflux system protein [Bacteroidota bacterium]WPV68509.1 monovalent cation:proton antiporter-2 (CPA2) family protein [Chitinophaga sp. LS1]